MIEWCILLSFIIICWLAFFHKISYVRGLKNNGNRQSARVYLQNRKIGEIPPVYPNGWFNLLESWHLKKGQVKHVAALGENFAVFRTKEGNVNIIDAYCPHLGANMAEGGKVLDDGCLQCPFHHWTFRGDGACKNIPYTNKISQTIKVRSWKCCEVNQFIFVWYHAEFADPEWYIEPVLEISRDKWRCHGRNQFLINSHIQEIPENGADWAHLNAVHGKAIIASGIFPGLSHHLWTGASWTPRRSSNESKIYDDNNYSDNESTTENSKINNDNQFVNDKHRATVTLQQDFIVGKKFTIMHLDVKAEQIGPGYVELYLNTALGRMCLLQTVTPIQPLVQCVTHTIFSPLIISPYTKMVFLAECIMFERDIAIWNHKKYQKNPRLVKEDRTIRAYRQWYSQFYSSSSPTYSDSIKSLDW